MISFFRMFYILLIKWLHFSHHLSTVLLGSILIANKGETHPFRMFLGPTFCFGFLFWTEAYHKGYFEPFPTWFSYIGMELNLFSLDLWTFNNPNISFGFLLEKTFYNLFHENSIFSKTKHLMDLGLVCNFEFVICGPLKIP